MAAFDVDELTVILLVSVLTLLLIHVVFLRPPAAQAHPILLGRQGDPSSVRNAGESAIWRSNQSVGRSVLLRPAPAVRSVSDLVVEPTFKARVHALAGGLAAQLQPGNVAIYTEDYEAAFSTVAALALLPGYTSLLIPTSVSSTRLAAALSGVSAVVTGPATMQEVQSATMGNAQIIVTSGAVGTTGVTIESLIALGKTPDSATKVSKVDAETVWARAVLADEHDGVSQVEITHTNMTAAVATISQIFPMAGRIANTDVVASFFDPAEPFGLALAFATVFSGAKLHLGSARFGGVDIVKQAKSVEPTLIFAPASATDSLAQITAELATSSIPSPYLVSLAYAGKLFRLRNGYNGPHYAWDPLVYKAVRQAAGFTRLRALLLVNSLGTTSTDEVSPPALDRLRITCSCPVMVASRHPVSLAPITVSHPFDVQAQTGARSHVGTPAPNLAIKVICEGGEPTVSANGGLPLTGEMLFSGPSTARPAEAGGKSTAWEEERRSGGDDGYAWFRTGKRVELRPNGTFVSLS